MRAACKDLLEIVDLYLQEKKLWWCEKVGNAGWLTYRRRRENVERLDMEYEDQRSQATTQ